MLDIVDKLANKLNDSGIKYTHFKSNEHLEQSCNGETDFDFLINKKDASKFEKCLYSLNAKRIKSQKFGTYPGVDDWLCFDDKTGELVHLHVHYQLITGKKWYKNYGLPWNKIALDTSITDKKSKLKIVSHEYEIIELYTRVISKLSIYSRLKYKMFGFKLFGNDLKEAEWLCERLDENKLNKTILMCFETEVDSQLFLKENLDSKDFRTLFNAINKVLKSNKRSGTNLVGLRSVFHKIMHMFAYGIRKFGFAKDIILKKNPHNGGLVITFLGVDGSGKSTVTKEIAEWLSWKMDVRRISLGCGRIKNTKRYKFKELIMQKLRNKKVIVKISVDRKADKKGTQKLLPQLIKLNFARQMKRDLKRIHSYALSGGIVITDRFPQNEYFGIADGPKIPEEFPLLSSLERKYLDIVNVIQPDIYFKLKLPVEISKKRRPEDNIDTLKRKYFILENIKYNKGEEICIDASKPLDKEILEIKKQIWQYL